MNIRDAVLGLDIDNAVSLRLLRFDNERDRQRAKFLAHEVAKTFLGTGDEGDGDLTIDANTLKW